MLPKFPGETSLLLHWADIKKYEVVISDRQVSKVVSVLWGQFKDVTIIFQIIHTYIYIYV